MKSTKMKRVLALLMAVVVTVTTFGQSGAVLAAGADNGSQEELKLYDAGERTDLDADEVATAENINVLLDSDYDVTDVKDGISFYIIFNSVSFLTGKKYRYEKGDWAKYIRPITNRLCDKYGLSTITIEDDRAVEHDTYTEWRDRKDGKFVWSDEVKQNKYPAVKPPGMERYRRCKYFGADYTEERLRERILTEDMEYYRGHHGGAKIIKVNVPYRIRRAKLTGIQRKYFARLYHIGRLKQRPYSQAWKYRDEIRKMHRLHEQYMFLSDHEIHSLADLERVYGQMSEKKKLLNCKRSRFYKERGRYHRLVIALLISTYRYKFAIFLPVGTHSFVWVIFPSCTFSFVLRILKSFGLLIVTSIRRLFPLSYIFIRFLLILNFIRYP